MTHYAKDLLALLPHATVTVAAIALILTTATSARAGEGDANLPKLGFREVPINSTR